MGDDQQVNETPETDNSGELEEDDDDTTNKDDGSIPGYGENENFENEKDDDDTDQENPGSDYDDLSGKSNDIVVPSDPTGSGDWSPQAAESTPPENIDGNAPSTGTTGGSTLAESYEPWYDDDEGNIGLYFFGFFILVGVGVFFKFCRGSRMGGGISMGQQVPGGAHKGKYRTV